MCQKDLLLSPILDVVPCKLDVEVPEDFRQNQVHLRPRKAGVKFSQTVDGFF